MVDYAVSLKWFLFWSTVWTIVLNIPPGSKDIQVAYRLNFWHGLICSILATLCVFGYLPESFTAMTTISYFFVDFVNIMLNDFYFKVKSYQTPSARKVEYVHHILCCSVGVASEFVAKKYCTFENNPFIKLMFAELSTPFLIGWRMYPEKTYLFYLFGVTFFAARIVYHGFVYIPECIARCDKTIGYGFGIPYNLMNAFFCFMILQKTLRALTKGDGKKKVTKYD